MITRCLNKTSNSNSDQNTKMNANSTSSSSSCSSVKFGFTSLSDRSLEEIQTYLGLVKPDQMNDEDYGNNHDYNENESNNNNQNRKKRQSQAGRNRCMAHSSNSNNTSNGTSSNNNLPESFDWRERSVVTPVRDQGECGSCWSFASLASLESALLIHQTNNSNSRNMSVDGLDLSEQQLIQCAKFSGTGCNGGNAKIAFSYIQRRGVTTARYMPYRAQNGMCPFFQQFPKMFHIDSYCIRSSQQYGGSNFEPEQLSDRDIQETLVKFGPLYIAVNADPLNSRNYRGGIMNDPSCNTDVNHAVTLVGYTNQSWIIKNSWGSEWGDDGYFELIRGKNMCGINTEIAWPLMESNNN